MRNLHLSPLALAVALTVSGLALANDPPAKPDAAKPADAKADPKADPKAAKAEAKKDDKPAEPELPSKPFPKVTSIPRPADKPAAKPADKAVEKPADKPAEKTAEKPSEKPAEKAAANAHGGGHDKPVDMVIEKVPVVKHEAPKKRKPAPQAAKHEPVKGALHDVARDAVDAHAHGQSGEVKSYVVEARDSLDSIIKKIFPTTPFSADVMREAFVKANPQVLADPKAKLRAGVTLRVPDQSMFRLVVLGDVNPPVAAKPHGDQPHSAPVEIIRPREPVMREASTPAIAVAPAPSMNNPPNPDVIAIPKPPVIVAGSEGPAPPVSPEEKKKWVRYP
jgi:phage tail protein X